MKKYKIAIYLLILAVTAVWLSVVFYPSKELFLVTCDVGQGDANLIIFGRIDVLIDGGPDTKVTECLDNYLPFWDRTIELAVITHPQKDHFMGLIDVFQKYKVERLLVSELNSDTQEYRVLEDIVGGSDTTLLRPIRGMSIRLGLIYLDILHPSKIFLNDNFAENLNNDDILMDERVLGKRSSDRNANDFSVVILLRYKDFEALFTGDIGPESENEILSQDIRNLEYLKIPHHGSKNGLSGKMLELIDPKIAVLSLGENNPHGHPHVEVIEMLQKNKVRFFRTDKVGDIIVSTDGDTIKVHNVK